MMEKGRIGKKTFYTNVLVIKFVTTKAQPYATTMQKQKEKPGWLVVW